MERVNEILTLLENGQQAKALSYYEEILSQGSNEERFVLGEELFQLGFLDEAKALFKMLLEAYPEEGELLVLLAETEMEIGNEEEAISQLEKINPEDASYPQSLLLLADLYQMDGLYEVSEQKLLQAKKILPNEVIIDFALGELYSEQGRIADAIKAYQTVVPEQTTVGGVNVNGRIADNMSAGGAFEEAINYYELALEEKIEINTLFNLALTALQAGQLTIAINRFEEVKTLDPDFHSLYLYLARSYEQEEMLQEAFETVQDGVKHDEFNKELYLLGGKLSLKLGDEANAEKYFREALAIDPEFTESVLLLNKLFLTQDRFGDIIELVELMDSQDIEEPQLLWDGAKALQGIENYSEALNKYQEAYTFFKELPDFLYDYGYFLLEEGKRQEAAEVFSSLLEKDPSNEEFIEIVQRLTSGE
ncbi:MULTISPECIES: tetratricopeptide repeat protein [Bacillaceae]|uniref:tetratricopeptide repeat protein n=1 Tax=Bacillaceae TaxID=186817 RepID=UPI001E3DA9C5|nr:MULTISPECIES: tetratricopeptide repeat protein [Bacillaceae]MCE4047223.1 tetratricopeptide repeat protein [Bacillus sp. Au-Bac7]MCM3031369.1 tetratricopeptide repeat protein [Niallia sp. MER 6]MDL0435760.1 tetratricopeptide repeat protein [Niallia sp. SS-2023]UPO86410.1 tetratricopeptide repeat protein [Niallia sp. Man26]